MPVVLDDATITAFRADGFVMLRGVFEPQPLTTEVDDALLHGMRVGAPINRGSAEVGFHGVIMMCERTPTSLQLIDRLAVTAAQLLHREVLPGRAKGIRYFGNSGWHVDSELPIESLSFAAYLEPLTATTGALRIRRGSHRGEDGSEIVVETEPGDMIAFDEHVLHRSVGGAARRQWRVDFVGDPSDDSEATLLRQTFERIFDPAWDGGDDADRYPSYGPYWQSLDRPWHARLRELGVYGVAERQRATTRTSTD